MVSTKVLNKVKDCKYLYMLLLPGFIAVALFCYGPMYGLWMAFSEYKLGKPILSAKFVGLRYFAEFITDSIDLISLLRNTICMNILSLLACLGVALIFSILLNEVTLLRFKKLVQTASFYPFFISWVIVYNIFNIFLAAESGVLNMLLVDGGVLKQGINFLGEPKYAWGLIVFTNLWKTLGYNSILFLASIAGIEQEMYEAAELDGADRFQKIRYITLPSLMPTLQVLIILNVGWIFGSNFDQYYLFTNAMNRSNMEVFDMYIYRFGLKQLNYSYATAVGMFKSLAGVFMLVVVNTLSKKLNGKGVL